MNLKKNYSSFFYLKLTLIKFLNIHFSKPKQSVNNIVLKQKSDYLLIYIFIQKPKQKKNKNPVIIPYTNSTYFFLKKNIDNYLKILNLPLKSKLFYSEITIPTVNKQFTYSLIFKIFQKKRQFTKFLYLFNIILYCQNIELLSSLLEQNLKKTKNHKWYLKSIYNIFKILFNKYNNFLGFKIQLKGRLNGKPRSHKMIIQQGKIPLNSINVNLKYKFKKIETLNGVCGLKIWLLFK